MTIGLNNLKVPKGAHKRRKIVGRGMGSGHGKTSTRGHKGQSSRTGHKTYQGYEGGQMPLIRKIPKRGFNSRNPVIHQIVNLKDLNRIKDEVINVQVLQKNRLIKKSKKSVKILGQGSIDRALIVEALLVSKSAKAKIEQAGGKIKT